MNSKSKIFSAGFVLVLGAVLLLGTGCGNKNNTGVQQQANVNPPAANQKVADKIDSIATESPDKNKEPAAAVDETLSEQPNKGKYNEYFTEIFIAKLPAGAEFNPWKIIKTKIFTAGEQFCTSMSMKKQIATSTLSSAVYDVNAKQELPRMGAFPQALGPGNSTGCESLQWPVGKYEYKIYVSDVLVAVFPFEVK